MDETGTWHADPAYTGAQSDPHDIAVIVLGRSPRISPAQLPAAGSNDNLPANQQFTSVGYGTLSAQNGPGCQTFPLDDAGRYAVGTLTMITKSWLRISQNAATGDGGTCYGDSGGAELPRRRRNRDEHRRRDHDHGRHAVPVHQRGLPPGHALGARLPVGLRRRPLGRWRGRGPPESPGTPDEGRRGRREGRKGVEIEAIKHPLTARKLRPITQTAPCLAGRIAEELQQDAAGEETAGSR